MLQYSSWEMIPILLSSYEHFPFPFSLGYLNGNGGGERKNQGHKPDVTLREGVYTIEPQGHH